jgi:hypothetical protein
MMQSAQRDKEEPANTVATTMRAAVSKDRNGRSSSIPKSASAPAPSAIPSSPPHVEAWAVRRADVHRSHCQQSAFAP